jgi:hypothetical protein
MLAAREINQSERDAFLRSIQNTGYAGISQVQSIYHTTCLQGHREAFINGKRGQRDGHRAALFIEAAKLKNASARVLEFYISLSKNGHKGTICPEELLAAQVVASTGGLCAPRTFRRALADLCARGWLHKEAMSTGTKVLTPTGWRTLQVNKITIPMCTRLLGVNRMFKNPPMQGEQQKFASSCPPSGDRPTPAKMATNGSLNPPPLSGGDSDSTIVNVEQSSKARNEESELTAVQPSPPSAAQTSPPLKHRHYSESRKAGKPLKMSAAPFARKSRSKIAKTWQNARLILLHDLTRQLTGADGNSGAAGKGAGAGAEFLQRIATVQTDVLYPPLFPVALDWSKYLPRWIELDWKERRRIVLREILPALRAWCAPWVIPPSEQLRPDAPENVRAAAAEQLRQYERVSAIMKSLPDMLTNGTTPRWVCEKINEYRWQLSQLPLLLTIGRIGLDDIRPGERQAFAEIAALVGASE